MVSIILNCDFDQAKNLSELEGKIFSTSWDPLWIRERSIEEDAVDQSSMQRLYDPEKISVNLEIKDAKEIEEGKILIKFSDNHEAKYCLNNLIKEIKRSKGLPKKVFWNKDNVIFQKFDFSYKDDEKKQLYNILDFYHKYGFVLVSGLKAVEGEKYKI